MRMAPRKRWHAPANLNAGRPEGGMGGLERRHGADSGDASGLGYVELTGYAP